MVLVSQACKSIYVKKYLRNSTINRSLDIKKKVNNTLLKVRKVEKKIVVTIVRDMKTYYFVPVVTRPYIVCDWKY